MNPLLAGEQSTVNLIQRDGVDVVLVDDLRARHTLRANIGETKNELNKPGGSFAQPSTIARTVDFLIPSIDLPCAITREITIEFSGLLYRPVSINNEGETRRSRFGLVTRIHTVLIGKA